jgi:hypothetical protein
VAWSGCIIPATSHITAVRSPERAIAAAAGAMGNVQWHVVAAMCQPPVTSRPSEALQQYTRMQHCQPTRMCTGRHVHSQPPVTSQPSAALHGAAAAAAAVAAARAAPQ